MVVTVRASRWCRKLGAYVVAGEGGRLYVAPLLLDRPERGQRLNVEDGVVTLGLTAGEVRHD